MAWHWLVAGFYAYLGIAAICLLVGGFFTIREWRHYKGVTRSLLNYGEEKGQELLK